jgi:hypothetical protein
MTDFQQFTLDNGLTIIGEVNRKARSASVGFFVRTGARDETPHISGVSHFLEHMLFKGTDELSALEVNAAFDRLGAKFNAFTSEENTVYYAAVLPEYLLDVSGLWMQLMRPSLRDDDFEIEKNVILEEIAMYKDLPQLAFPNCQPSRCVLIFPSAMPRIIWFWYAAEILILKHFASWLRKNALDGSGLMCLANLKTSRAHSSLYISKIII